MGFANGVFIQFFQWHSPPGTLWAELGTQAAALRGAGFTGVWLPPAGKGAGGTNDVGYGAYDLFDLGEFDQKGAVATKYGTKAQLLTAIGSAHAVGLQVYGDVVFNHKDGADFTEDVWVQEVDWDDRNRPLGDWQLIKAWTGFDFPGRGDVYSSMKWRCWSFDAVSYDENRPGDGNRRLYRLKDKPFATEVSHEHGNFDYLIACDLDLDVDLVRGELTYWGRWFIDTTGVDGFRIDACKHIRSSFFPDWLAHLRGHFGRPLFSVGEYWSGDVEDLHAYLTATGGALSLFDVPLHFRFRAASLAGNGYDMRTIFDKTLVKEQPALAVTFVDNHDTQPGQSLESWVEPWFKPLAYALILLRRDGYPCVFYADYYPQPRYDDGGRQVTLYCHRFLIDRFLRARRDYGFGDQHDYFDHPNTVGWLRTGDAQHPGVMAVVLTNGAAGTKWMNTFHPGARFRDATGHSADVITANGDGWALFSCPGGSVSVWLQE
ncbi:MAG TPA: alpha-amylase [Polyangia bacterium]|nr:alpha-amylase [Polyangia bacterium]